MTAQRSRFALRTLLATAVAAGALLVGALGAAPASAKAPYFALSTSAAPTNLPAGGKGKVLVTASNLGDEVTSGAFTVTDKLPTGLKAVAIKGELANQTGELVECKL